jgi:tRNA modification GTPase
VHALDEALAQLRAHVEATIDFPADEIDFLAEHALTERLAGVRGLCAALQATARQGRLLTEGLTVVIAGAPNAGKSTLLNRLAGHEAAIVTDIPGTTRDVLRERIQLEGVPLLLLDTAGLRDSRDAIEAEGMRRARAAMAQADHVLFLVDALRDPGAAGYEAERARIPGQVPVTILFNKIDLLSDRASGARVLPALVSVPQLRISASTGAGIEALRRHLLEAAGYQADGAGALSARRRHLEALAATAAHLDHAARQCREAGAGELVAEELRAAQRALGEITGTGTAEELLGRIFSAFCIGK